MAGSGADHEPRFAQQSQLAAEQAALRRVAMLVARQGPADEIFTAVAAELGCVLGVEDIRMVRFDEAGERSIATVVASWGSMRETTLPVGERAPLGGENVTSEVFRTGRSARKDDYSTASGAIGKLVREGGVGSAVGAPVTVGGSLWGAILASATEGGPLPADTEPRLGQFTELMGTAIANAEARAELGRLAEEQAALRRVATLVAEESAAAELFAKVAEEVAKLFGEDVESGIVRYEGEESAMVVAVWGRQSQVGVEPGKRLPLEGDNAVSRVFRERRSVRIDDYPESSGSIGGQARELGTRSAVGCPISVHGRLWGAMVVSRLHSDPFPTATERYVAEFTELVATAIANAEARGEIERLAEEQAALRRVATLVAKSAPPSEVFTAATDEVAKLLGARQVALARLEGVSEITVVAIRGKLAESVRPGRRVPIDGDSVIRRVVESERAVQLNVADLGDGSVAKLARSSGVNATVGAPVWAQGRLWGVIAASWREDELAPPRAMERLDRFAELLGTAIANAEAQGAVRRLADEQAGLRRVATLVAEGAAPGEVFETVIAEVRALLDAALVALARFEGEDELKFLAYSSDLEDFIEVGNVVPLDSDSAITRALRSGRAARIDVREEGSGPIVARARSMEMRIGAASPIKVEGKTWGVIAALWHADQEVSPGTEERMGEFAQLLDTAIANAEARTALERLADEQAGLRRVATLVAEGAAPAAVFDAAMGEVCMLLDAAQVGLMRVEPPDEMTLLAHAGQRPEVLEVGMRMPLREDSVTARVLASGSSARIDAEERGDGVIADLVRRNAVTITVGAPVTIEGSPWGVITASWAGDQVPPEGAEQRLDKFAQLLATAIGNAESRSQVARLADEQAALRRVATLVAEEAPAADLLAKVAEEVALFFGPGIDSAILRYEDEQARVVAVWGEQPPDGIRVGAVLPIDGSGVSARVYHEHAPVRIDDYGTARGAIAEHAGKHGIRAAVGCPITVEGRLWGAMVVAHYAGEPFPAEGERRVAKFAELVATAIANAEARAEVQRLAEEQAALRRVATLVAQGAEATEVFDAVVAEVRMVLGSAQHVGLVRYEGADAVTVLAQHRDAEPDLIQVGMRLPLDGDSVTARVLHTGAPVHVAGQNQSSGTIAELARKHSVHATLGVPVRVDGAIWGTILASWEGDREVPPDAAERLAEFAELLDTAIANADSRDQLTASRARVLTAGDEARRRVVRDLHDGAQQRLVHTIVTLQLAQRALGEDGGEEAAAMLAEALDHAQRGNAELRELAHGIMPSVLARGGLRAGVDAFASRLELPVTVAVSEERLPPEIEASAYFVVAEALTNVVKHAEAGCAEVTGEVEDGVLRLAVRDDGVGGADPTGHGLLGVADRVAALGGRLRVESPRGGGTLLAAELPLGSADASAPTHAGR